MRNSFFYFLREKYSQFLASYNATAIFKISVKNRTSNLPPLFLLPRFLFFCSFYSLNINMTTNIDEHYPSALTDLLVVGDIPRDGVISNLKEVRVKCT